MQPERFQLSPIKAIELAASKIPGTVSLAQGIPSFSTPEVIKDFVYEKIKQGFCDKYSLTTGLAELREEIALSLQKDEGLLYDPQTEIIITVGSIEGITAAILASTNPGDDVLLPSPTYASYLGAISIARCNPRYFELNEDDNFDFEVERIRKSITRKTTAILYCSPNNPTGTLFSEAKTRELLQLAEAHNLTVITDEVYKDFYYTDDRHFSPCLVPEARNRVIRVCSFSKAYAMTGWRVGFLHADSERIRSILKYHDAMVTCAPVVSQYAAIAALRYGEPYLKGFRRDFKDRRDYTISRLDQMSHVLDYQLPRATYFVFPRIKSTVPLAGNSHDLAYDILEKAHVAVVPGSAFGPSGESHLRITFGRSPSDLKTGMDRLAEYFSKLRVEAHTTFSGTASETRSVPSIQAPVPLSTYQPVRKKLARFILRKAARLFLKRHNMLVIGVAGTLGKTVVKRTLVELFRRSKNTRGNILSYNTEVGLPLSILGVDRPKTTSRLFFSFLPRLLWKALFQHDSTEILILEYGIARLSDAQALTAVVVPDWLVIGEISSYDPGVDCTAIRDGVRHLASYLPADRILWAADDAWVKDIRPDLKDELSMRLSQISQNKLTVGASSYSVQRELVGDSAHIAVIAAVTLAKNLSIPDSGIYDFLADRVAP